MGAATIVAVSRRGTGRLGDLAAELASCGTNLVEVAADAADPAAMRALFDRFGTDLPPLDGIYLAALAGTEALISEMTDHDVNSMFAPKLDAAAVLHTLSLTMPVRRFVLFSSVTGIIGSRWLGHYGGQRLSRHVGLCPSRPGTARDRRRLGTMEDLGRRSTVDDGGGTVAHAQRHGHPDAAGGAAPDADVASVVVAADWARLADAYRMRAPMPVVDHLLAGAAAGAEQVGPPTSGTLLGEAGRHRGTGSVAGAAAA